ncbi:helix-turn-helix domain-containing protein [Paenarthrobacter ureafaciens]|uniref:helix-turn-helix domain-containing protein n=1 Tax=Paenarthrobacter ureafaciens TaxID=37931 RepID=UPI001917906D|nr:helix-turn-helix domain-containing protein [Paenarthrobacter ureafaciens]QQQ62810.1 helix-turn-helix domain-containing protein [Paenarthrobacter ureafaciens]
MALSIPELGKRLGIHESRARQLVRSGRIRGQRVGGRWIVDEADAAQYRPGRPAGRPLSERSAWQLMLRFREDALIRDFYFEDLEPSAVERHRLHERVDRLQHAADPLGLLSVWLVNRAEKYEFSSSPSDIADMREDKRIHLSGISHPAAGLLSNSEVEAYVQRDGFDDVVRDWFLVEPSPHKRPNVVLRVAGHVPEVLPPLAVAADLAERPGFREQQAALEIVRSLIVH